MRRRRRRESSARGGSLPAPSSGMSPSTPSASRRSRGQATGPRPLQTGLGSWPPRCPAPPPPAPAAGGDGVENLRADLRLLNGRLGDLEAQVRTLQRPRGPPRQGGGAPRSNNPRPAATSGCFKCGQPGHFARGCVNTVMGQFQMTTPLDPSYPPTRGGEPVAQRDAEKEREPHAEGN